jgi:hypothetical protein
VEDRLTERIGVRGAQAVALVVAASLVAVACASPAAREGQATGAGRSSQETPEPTPSEPRLERTFTTLEVSGEDGGLPVEELERLPGSGSYFTWDPDSPEAESAGSAARFTRGDPATLFTSIPKDAGRVEAQLNNETTDRKLEVKGHIVYRLTGPDGTTEHLSEPLDAVLGPGESLTVVFILELPDGDYESTSVFIPQEA